MISPTSPTILPEALPALWTAQEVAGFLHVCRRKVFSDLSRGAIPCIRLPGGAPRFRPSDIDLWLELGCPSADEFQKWKAAPVGSRM